MAARTSARRPSAPGRGAPRIAVLGDVIVDVAARLAGPIIVGSDTPARVDIRQGGSAANTARWLGRLGARAIFIGSVGRDRWGRALTTALAADGVIVHAPRVAGRTARLVALVAPDGERSFVTDRGAADGLTAAAIRDGWWRGVRVLHLPAYSLLAEPLAGAAARAVTLARRQGAAISVDLASAGPLVAAGPAVVLGRLRTLAPDVLFGNLAEMDVMGGAGDPGQLLDVAPVVVVKAGPAGCRILVRSARREDAAVAAATGSLVITVPTAPLEARDTTGAGDAFAAGFLLAWASSPAASRHAPDALERAARAGHRAARRALTARRRDLEP
ncbi:MAG: carbohydrate kinase family protein [Candidatus Limnocylindrales bacterium]